MAEAKSRFPWPAGKRAAVSLSFDDARLSQIDRGMAIFNAHGVKATFYVSPGGVTARLDGWKSAVANGHEIGNHTLHHPCSGNFKWSREKALEDYSIEQIEREILDANRFIQETLGVTPATFAYPCGQTYVGRGRDTASYVPLIAEHFLVGRAASSEIHNDPAFCDLAQAACMGSDGRSFEQLEAMVGRAVADGGWLILCGHEIGDGGSQTTLAPALDALCRYCKDPANGIWVDTVATIGRYVAEKQGGS
ncbi:MAG TPA: polysaccharide deacetylase family protein [Planctomycetota bacterium]|nr:polysaccharide deacetylase family protein [Planctomycetota bacterium]